MSDELNECKCLTAEEKQLLIKGLYQLYCNCFGIPDKANAIKRLLVKLGEKIDVVPLSEDDIINRYLKYKEPESTGPCCPAFRS